MTLCIAALADDRKTIVMAADRIISVPFIESELDIFKIMPIHENWWAMLAADSLPGAFPVIDGVRAQWEPQTDEKVENVVKLVSDLYQHERRARAEAQFLVPRGLTVDSFLAHGKEWLPEITFRELDMAMSNYNLGLSLLVCGFDRNKLGHIFTVGNPGTAQRLDIPGFHAIGSGYYGAEYMMFYRELSPATTCHEWLYYIYEAKAFGEMAGAVGMETELLVAQPDRPVHQIDNDGYHTSLDRMWNKYRPGDLEGRDIGILKRIARPKQDGAIEEPSQDIIHQE